MAALLFDFKQQKIKLKNNASDKRLWLRKMIMCRMRNAKTACQIKKIWLPKLERCKECIAGKTNQNVNPRRVRELENMLARFEEK